MDVVITCIRNVLYSFLTLSTDDKSPCLSGRVVIRYCGKKEGGGGEGEEDEDGEVGGGGKGRGREGGGGGGK